VSGEGAARRFKFAPILTATVFTVLLLWIAGQVAHVFLLLFIGIMISVYLGALSGVLQRRARIPGGWALAAAVLITLGGLAVLFYILVPPLILQTRELVRVLPTYITGWEAAIDRLVGRVPALASVYEPGQHKLLLALYDQVAAQFNDVVPKVFGIVEVLISIFSVCVMGLYLAIHPALYREWLIALFPPIHRDLVRDGGPGPGPAQQRTNARQQLTRAEGFGEVVVGAQFEPHDAVGLVHAPGQHQDGNLRLLAQATRDLHAVFPGKPHVQDHDVDCLARHRVGQLPARCHRGHPQFVVGKVFGNQVAHGGIVVQRQHVR